MLTTGAFQFDFIEDIAPDASKCLKKMEEYFFSDPSSAMAKARLYIEEIINQVWEKEDIELRGQLGLYDKISYLSREGYITSEVRQSFDTIRIKGNKAAHDAQFDEIKDAYIIHREAYKIAVWFYEVYSSNSKPIPPYEIPKVPSVDELVKQQVEVQVANQIQGLLKNINLSNVVKNVSNTDDSAIKLEDNNSKDIEDVNTFKLDLPEGKSYLVRELKRLRASSIEAVDHATNYNYFKDYMHIERPIQKDLEEILETRKDSKKNLILICGNVGDGKSHLLSYVVNKAKKELTSKYKIINDATESYSPEEDSMQTLEKSLSSFSDENWEQNNEHIILAINMGVLHNFVYRSHENHSYEKLKKFVEESMLFTQNITTKYNNETIDLLSFGDYHMYELTEFGPRSSFYEGLLKKICSNEENNPFYMALIEDEKNNIHSIVHQNYNILCNEHVQRTLISLMIELMIRNKKSISSREFLDFLADILIPDEYETFELWNDFEKLNNLLPSLLFNHPEKSEILKLMGELNPIHRRNEEIDKLIVQLNTMSNWTNTINLYIKDETCKELIKTLVTERELVRESANQFLEYFITFAYLTNDSFTTKLTNRIYQDYMQDLYNFNNGNIKNLKNLYDQVLKAIFEWQGRPKAGYIYIDKKHPDYLIAEKLDLHPFIERIDVKGISILESFKEYIVLEFTNGIDIDRKVKIEIDYQLYELLRRVIEGYRPNKKDEERAVNFIEFLNHSIELGSKSKEVLVKFVNEKRMYTLKENFFGGLSFEREGNDEW